MELYVCVLAELVAEKDKEIARLKESIEFYKEMAR